jgi:hypothetical protein
MKLLALAYTEEETSQITSISKSALQKSRKAPYTAIKNGKYPPFYKDGGSVLYRWADVMDFMDNRTVIGKPEKEVKKEQVVKPKSTVNSPANAFFHRLNY